MTNFTVTHSPYKSGRVGRFCANYPDECAIKRELSDDEFNRYSRLHRDNRLALKFNFHAAVARLKLTDHEINTLASVLDLSYRSRVNHLDRLFGRVLDAVKEAELLEESMIVFTADHGETLFKNSALFKWSHGHTLRNDVLSVPLVIRAPSQGIQSGHADFVTRSVDLFPTLSAARGALVRGGGS